MSAAEVESWDEDPRGYPDEKIATLSRQALITALRHSRRRQQSQGVRLAEWRARAEAAEALIALREYDGPADDGVAAVKAAQAALSARNARRPDRKLRSDFATWQAKRERLIATHDAAVAIHREAKGEARLLWGAFVSAPDWKQVHANAADKAVTHALVQNAITELLDNLGLPLDGLPAYGVTKVATYAAQVARAQALGFDPDLLRLTPGETHSEQLRLASEAVLRGIPTHMIDPDDPGEPS